MCWIVQQDFDTDYGTSGGKFGGTAIDRAFLAWMEAEFGTAFTNLPSSKTGPGSGFMQQFEKAKRNLDGEANSKMHFELPLKMNLPKATNADPHDHYDAEEAVVKLSG